MFVSEVLSILARRGIIDKALDLIWGAELPTQKISSEWFDVWKRAGE